MVIKKYEVFWSLKTGCLIVASKISWLRTKNDEILQKFVVEEFGGSFCYFSIAKLDGVVESSNGGKVLQIKNLSVEGTDWCKTLQFLLANIASGTVLHDSKKKQT